MSKNGNPWAISERDVALARLDEFVEESGGYMRLYVIRYNNKDLGRAVAARETLAIALAKTIDGALKQLKRETVRRCLSCDHTFSPDGMKPHAFVVWVPGEQEERPENMMAQPVCMTCCASRNDKQLLEDAVLFIKQIFPESEEIGEEIIDE